MRQSDIFQGVVFSHSITNSFSTCDQNPVKNGKVSAEAAEQIFGWKDCKVEWKVSPSPPSADNDGAVMYPHMDARPVLTFVFASVLLSSSGGDGSWRRIWDSAQDQFPYKDKLHPANSQSVLSGAADEWTVYHPGLNTEDLSECFLNNVTLLKTLWWSWLADGWSTHRNRWVCVCACVSVRVYLHICVYVTIT